jgi:hypothetical protein
MKKRGYALPLSLCVAGVTLMLGLSAAQMANGDLSLANHDYYQERARQAADFGLEYCVSHSVAPGTLLTVPSQSGAHPFDSVTVQMYNHGEAGAPLEVPEGFEYWVAEGRASDRPNGPAQASSRLGALVRYGLSNGSSGAMMNSFHISSPDPVDFQAMDGVTGQAAVGESICSSEYDGVGAFFAFPGQSGPIDLGVVGGFGGPFRIPRGVSQSVVHFGPGSGTVPISPDGGKNNVPTYTPPSGLQSLGRRSLPNNYSGNLPAGHYEWLEIPADATVSLRGTYQFDQLVLAPGVSAGQGGLLKVSSGNTTKVFVDKIDLGQGSLGLSNENRSAQNFRFTLKTVRPDSAPPVLHFKLPAGGGIAFTAAGHRVSLEADSSREIRGAFSADAVELKFPPSSAPYAHNPTFVYDVSGSTARRARTNGGINPSGNLPPDPPPDPGDTSSNYYDGTDNVSTTGSDGVVTEPEVNIQTGSLTQTRPAGAEPLILSRQPL